MSLCSYDLLRYPYADRRIRDSGSAPNRSEMVDLLLTIFTFTYLGSLKSDRTFIHKNLVVALMISDLLFIAGVGETKIKIACKVIAILLHFFYLSVFSWMLTEGLHLYNMVVRVFGSETSRWKVYSLLGWGIPVLVVGITTAIDHDGYGSDGGCWLIVERGFIWAFVGPAVGIIVVNMAVMCMVLKIIIQSTNVKAGSSKEQAKAGVKGAIFLLPLLGLTWAFGLMAINSDTVIFQYLFTIFNSLQGFFVFFFHCLMNSEVRQAWRLKRKQIMLSRGEFIDSNAISAHLGLNATGSSGQCDLNCVDYVIDPEDIRTSNLSTTQGSSRRGKEQTSRSNVQDIKLTGASDPSRGPVTRPRKRRPQPVLRCETPIEESIPGAILEDTDLMEEVRVTHRIIENDDWTVEEKRHVTRKMMKKKPSTNQSEPRDGVSRGNDASADYTGPAQPAYATRKCPQYSAPGQSDGRGALVRTPPTNDNKDEPSNGSIDLAIKNVLFNGGGYTQYSKGNGKGKLSVAKGANSRVDLPDLPGSSQMEHPSPSSSNAEGDSDDGADF
ncbi:cadherin EGF LAG seven-pass G-type receptor 1-like [Strongylocentrotus purpuratus]|uniref:G-protein coupled receptors family 2 profile 2 domain-containing protein n=1 Tax=Strongylocentrotus purpuratus TaxID=7668 RepID=A0A7M7NPP4_STRPU|nr:cadherin EGF LAG seven-pass G-type receptor 1-like [Strongylocentrotus purpuratus]